jgi:hypothetical protein
MNNTISTKYQVHYDSYDQTYWIGFVVQVPSGSPAFVQQVGKSYQYKGNAVKQADKLNEKVA